MNKNSRNDSLQVDIGAITLDFMKDVGMSTCKLSFLLFLFVFYFALPSLLYLKVMFINGYKI